MLFWEFLIVVIVQIAYGLPVFDIFFKMFCHGSHGVTDVE
jgi:hypothetical protein